MAKGQDLSVMFSGIMKKSMHELGVTLAALSDYTEISRETLGYMYNYDNPAYTTRKHISNLKNWQKVFDALGVEVGVRIAYPKPLDTEAVEDS